MLFDGGGGANGFANSMYIDLGTTAGTTTLTQPLVVTFQVVGLLATATSERSFTAGTSTGSLARGSYDSASKSTTLTWTLPAGTVIPPVGTGASVPDVLISFGDGLSSAGRITNKVVIVGISGGNMALPIDSSVQRDVGGISPDGIY